MKKGYHHGDLKNALITDSINHLNNVGLEDFSLRKVAIAAGVTPSAVYAHYKDKYALLNAVGQYAYKRFYEALEKSVTNTDKTKTDTYANFAKAYVSFALNETTLFNLIFSSYFSVNNHPETKALSENIQQIHREILLSTKLANESNVEKIRLACWSRVHGFTALLLQGNFSHIDNSNHNEVFEELMEMSLINIVGCA